MSNMPQIFVLFLGSFYFEWLKFIGWAMMVLIGQATEFEWELFQLNCTWNIVKCNIVANLWLQLKCILESHWINVYKTPFTNNYSLNKRIGLFLKTETVSVKSKYNPKCNFFMRRRKYGETKCQDVVVIVELIHVLNFQVWEKS